MGGVWGQSWVWMQVSRWGLCYLGGPWFHCVCSWVMTSVSVGCAEQGCNLLSCRAWTWKCSVFVSRHRQCSSGLDFGLPWWLSDKESACQSRRCGFNPWVETIHWRRKWQPTPVFLPGEFHGQRSLAGYSPWVRKEWGTTWRLNSNKSAKVRIFTYQI